MSIRLGVPLIGIKATGYNNREARIDIQTMKYTYCRVRANAERWSPVLPRQSSAVEENPWQDPSGDNDRLEERKQVAMYLPADQRRDLVDFYEELDARSTLAGDGGLEKNRAFYVGMTEFVLNRRGEFATSLGVELDE